MSPEEKPLCPQQILSAVWRCTLNRDMLSPLPPMDQQRGPTGQLEDSAELAFTRAAEKGDQFPAVLVKCTDKQEPELGNVAYGGRHRELPMGRL